MKKSLSGAMLFNIIIIFLIAVFALLAATLSYTKAYQVNTRIISAIEKYEGYNDLSLSEINYYLRNLGYMSGENNNCANIKELGGQKGTLVTDFTESYYYCVYKFDNDGDKCHYSYAAVTYITIDLPVINSFKISVTAQTNRIYDFNKEGGSSCVNP